MLTFVLAFLLHADCPSENPAWLACSNDLECVAVRGPCGRFKSVRRSAAGEAEARGRCQEATMNCADSRQEAVPETLCHAKKCWLNRDLVNEAMRTKSLKLFTTGAAKNVDVSLSPIHETPLTLAALNGNVAMVKHALARGAKVDLQTTTGYTALMFAAMARMPNALPVVDLLLAAGADRTLKNTRGETAAELAQDPEVRARLK